MDVLNCGKWSCSFAYFCIFRVEDMMTVLPSTFHAWNVLSVPRVNVLLTHLKIFLLLFNYSCPNFSPLALTCTDPPSTPHSHPVHVHGSFMLFLWIIKKGCSPSLPHYPSPSSPLVTIILFFISMSLVLFCSFVLLIRFHL